MENKQASLEQKINKEIDKGLKEGKELDQIEKEVKEMFANSKPVEVKSVYNGKNELLKLVDQIDKLKTQLPADIAKINPDLRDEIQAKRKAELEINYKLDIQNMREELARIEKKHNKYFLDGVKKLQVDPEYKQTKRDIFNILLALGPKLEADLVAELIQPLVEARDLSALRILEKTKSPVNSIAYRMAIRKVEEFNNNNELSEVVREIERYLNNPSTTKNLAFRLALEKCKR